MAGPRPAPYYTGPNVEARASPGAQVGYGIARGITDVGAFFLDAAQHTERAFVEASVKQASEEGAGPAPQTGAETLYGIVPTVALRKGGITADAYNKAALANYGDRLTTFLKEKSLDLAINYHDNPGALKQAYDHWHATVRGTIPERFQTEFDKQGLSIFAPLYLHNVAENEKVQEKLRKAAEAAAADANARYAFNMGGSTVRAVVEARTRNVTIDEKGDATPANFDPDVTRWPKPQDPGNIFLTAPATDAPPSRIVAAAAASGRFNASLGQTIARLDAIGRVPGTLEGRPSEAVMRRLGADVSSYTLGYFQALPYADKEATFKNVLNGRLPIVVPTADGQGHTVVDAWRLLSPKTAHALTTRMKELTDKEFTLNERRRESEERETTREVDTILKALAITGDSRLLVVAQNHPGATSAQVEKARSIAQTWDVVTDRPFYDEMHSAAARGIMPPVETWDASTLRRIGRDDRAKLEERNAKALNYLADPRVKTAMELVKTEVGEISSTTSIVMQVKEAVERGAVMAALETKTLRAIEQASTVGAVLGRTSRSGIPGPGGEVGGEVQEIIKSKAQDGTEKSTLVFDPLAFVQREITRAKGLTAEINATVALIDKEKAGLDADRAKLGNRRLTDIERKESDAKYTALRKRRDDAMKKMRSGWRDYLREE